MLRRTLAAGASAAGAVVLLASPAAAHVSVSAPGAAPGGFATLTFSVPNERDDATTTKVQVTMPEGNPIPEASVEPVPGWTVDVQKAPLDTPVTSDEGDEITEAVSTVTWSGGSIAAGQFQRFVVSAGPLPEGVDSLTFPTIQTYSDGEEVRWIEDTPPGGDEPENPAPVLELTGASDSDGGATSDTTASSGDSSGSGDQASAVSSAQDDADAAKALGIVGIVVGAVGLLVGLGALLARRRPTDTA